MIAVGFFAALPGNSDERVTTISGTGVFEYGSLLAVWPPIMIASARPRNS